MGSRRFEFVEGSSSKFWEVEVSGSEYTTRWGRIGTDGQSKTKSCKSDDAAQTEADKLIAEKTGKGYVEVGGTAKPATKATTKAVAKPAAAKKAAATTKQAEPAKKTVAATTKTALVSGKAKGQAKAAAAPAATAVETATATDEWTEREFEFNDAKSSKFWRIALDGTSHTVTFGKIGTNGQSKTKDFSSEAAAKKDAEKLIAEKTSKGYVEKGGSAGNGAAPKAAPAKKAAPKAAGKGKGNEADDEDDESPAATPAATRAPSAATFSLSTERKLTLTPREWAVATWRKESQKPLPSEKPAPFDKAAAIKVVKKIKYRYEFPVRMLSPEEAHFWLHVGTKLVWSGFDKPEQLEKMTFDGKIDRKQAVALAARAAEVGSTTIAAVGLAGMIGTVDAIDEAMSFAPAGYARMQSEGFGEVLAQLVPFLDEKSREELRKRIRKNVTPQQWPTDYYNAPPLEIALAPSLGMHKELAAIVKSWPDNNYTGDAWHDHYHHPQLVVFGLGSAGEVEAEFRRLRLRLRKPEHVRAWLAHTEYSALDYVAESLRAESNRDEATKLVEAFASAVEAPEAAGPMLDLKLNSKAPKIAKDWLDTHVAHGVAGLVPIAAGRGKAADAAIQQLLEYKRAGHEKLIIEAQKATPNSDRVKTEVINRVEKTYTPFDDKSTPKWLADGAAALAKAKRKGKLGDPMPPVVVGDHRFNDAQTDLLIRGLQASTWDKPAAIVKGLREHGDADSLDTVAWHLFEQWLTEGAPSGEKWAMMAIGFLGGDRSALKLTPMVRAWPGESQHKRAVTGLECLRQIGSDVALMQLNGIAQKLKCKGLKTTAQSSRVESATARGRTRCELED
ncbi:MAG: WGR domain-containing protein, partial [Planctomycetota bacterium]